MKKYFLYIDESKRLQDGIIILSGFLSIHNKAYCANKIERFLEQIELNNCGELKSTSKYGAMFIERNGIEKLAQSRVIDTVVWVCVQGYYRDSYEWYRDAMLTLLSEIGIEDDISIIYLDTLPLVSNRKDLQKYLKRDIISVYPNVKNIIPEISATQRVIQIADLITWQVKKYYLFRENPSLQEIFGNIQQKIKKKIS